MIQVFLENQTADIKYVDNVVALNVKFEDLKKATCVLSDISTTDIIVVCGMDTEKLGRNGISPLSVVW